MELPQRRSIRYNGYDYSMAGYYALTICARDKAHVFGTLATGETIRLTLLGEMVAAELVAIPSHFPAVWLDTWVLMPNHLHSGADAQSIGALERGGWQF